MTNQELRELPKIELHRHLDGSVRFETIVDLWRSNDLDLGVDTVDELREQATIVRPMSDLTSVLRRFRIMQQVLCSYEAVRRVALENVEDVWRDGVRLAELRFAPAFIAEGADLSDQEIVEAVLDGVREGMARWPVEIGLIGILPRGFDLEHNRAVTAALIRLRDSHPDGRRICGFDLAAEEEGIDPTPYIPLVEQAREASLGITIHTGENTSAEWVRRSLDLYRPDRIGHGIKAWDDTELLKRLAADQVPLEISPTSNWLTRSVPSLEEHPLPRLHQAGVPLSINSDDPHLFAIDLVHEYRICRDLFGFTVAEFREINRNALGQSFLGDPIKEAVRRELT
jgi:adenosine deaminase